MSKKYIKEWMRSKGVERMILSDQEEVKEGRGPQKWIIYIGQNQISLRERKS